MRSEVRNDEAEIHFDQGQIVGVTQRWSLRRLGQQLLRAGKLTERELERGLELQRETPSKPLGQILMEMGSVTETELRAAVRLPARGVDLRPDGLGRGLLPLRGG